MTRKIKNRNMVKSDLTDPTGWTVENNPHPYPYPESVMSPDAGSDYDWKLYMEWDDDGIHVIKCHKCISRAKIGSGNCRDGGEYFICLPKDVREGKVPYKRPVKTVQSKLW